MDDLEVLKKLQAETAPCGEILGLQCLRFQSDPPEIEIEFNAKFEFTHSDGQVVQGRFCCCDVRCADGSPVGGSS